MLASASSKDWLPPIQPVISIQNDPDCDEEPTSPGIVSDPSKRNASASARMSEAVRVESEG